GLALGREDFLRGEYQPLRGDCAGPKRPAGRQREAPVIRRRQDREVLRRDEALASHLVAVVAPAGLQDDDVARLQVVEVDPVDVVGRHADVAGLTGPLHGRVVAGPVGERGRTGPFPDGREVVELGYLDCDVDAVYGKEQVR